MSSKNVLVGQVKNNGILESAGTRANTFGTAGAYYYFSFIHSFGLDGAIQTESKFFFFFLRLKLANSQFFIYRFIRSEACKTTPKSAVGLRIIVDVKALTLIAILTK